jgi:hypothetical protein
MKTVRAAARFAVPLLLFMALSTVAVGGVGHDSFPQAPDPKLTAGSLCDEPDEFRYRERIAYCRRDVDRQTKQRIIATYDRVLGYRIAKMDRQDFKIDHYIPLCAGGSNDVDNLWPQHETVYEITDPMEQRVCEKMAEGALKQKDAVELIRMGKNDLAKVKKIMNHLNSL